MDCSVVLVFIKSKRKNSACYLKVFVIMNENLILFAFCCGIDSKVIGFEYLKVEKI